MAAELRGVNEALWTIEDRLRECERSGDFGSGVRRAGAVDVQEQRSPGGDQATDQRAAGVGDRRGEVVRGVRGRGVARGLTRGAGRSSRRVGAGRQRGSATGTLRRAARRVRGSGTVVRPHRLLAFAAIGAGTPSAAGGAGPRPTRAGPRLYGDAICAGPGLARSANGRLRIADPPGSRPSPPAPTTPATIRVCGRYDRGDAASTIRDRASARSGRRSRHAPNPLTLGDSPPAGTTPKGSTRSIGPVHPLRLGPPFSPARSNGRLEHGPCTTSILARPPALLRLPSGVCDLPPWIDLLRMTMLNRRRCGQPPWAESGAVRGADPRPAWRRRRLDARPPLDHPARRPAVRRRSRRAISHRR